MPSSVVGLAAAAGEDALSTPSPSVLTSVEVDECDLQKNNALVSETRRRRCQWLEKDKVHVMWSLSQCHRPTLNTSQPNNVQ
eukprot:scaffold2597_cov86-Alexandrium_tamarense.AAC.1